MGKRCECRVSGVRDILLGAFILIARIVGRNNKVIADY